MKVQQFTQTNINRGKYPTFQKGLPRWLPIKACEKSVKEMESIVKSKGVEVNFKDMLPVAASCLATTEVFEAYKLPLPSAFSLWWKRSRTQRKRQEDPG